MSRSKVIRLGLDDATGYVHEDCGGEIVYNGNYFCSNRDTCGWALPCWDYPSKRQELVDELVKQKLAPGLAENRGGRYRRIGVLKTKQIRWLR